MITLKRVDELLSRFPDRRLLVFGDVILDRYIFGEVRRISPEAPVPVVTVTREEERLGGAGNVAANIDSLGGRGFLLGVSGEDEFAKRLRQLKPTDYWVAADKSNRTIVKTRIIAGKQHVARLDREESFHLSDRLQRELKERLGKLLPEVEGVIVSDYAKGTVARPLLDALRQGAEKGRIPVVADPKPIHWHLYRHMTGITPNLREAEEMVQRKLSDEKEIGRALIRIRNRLATDFVVITRGSEGMSAGQRGKRLFHVPAHTREVYDVTGAGDTVAAVLTLVLVCGGSLREAVAVANGAASLAVERIGTSQVTVEQLKERMHYLLKRH